MIAGVLGTAMLIVSVLCAEPAAIHDQVPPALMVQVVDKGWLPIPGIHVVVTCQDTVKRACRFTETTDVNGQASFDTERQGYFEVRVPDQGGFKGQAIKVRLFVPTSPAATAHVQLRITETLKYMDIKD